MAEKTAYRVLKQHGDTWTEDGPIMHTTSAAAAVREAVALRIESNVDATGIYVAVPARSWKPTPVKVEQTVVVKVGV